MNPFWLAHIFHFLEVSAFPSCSQPSLTCSTRSCYYSSGPSQTFYGPDMLCSWWRHLKKKNKPKMFSRGGSRWMCMMLIKGNECRQNLLEGHAWEQGREWAFPCVVLLAGEGPRQRRGHPHAASPEGNLDPGWRSPGSPLRSRASPCQPRPHPELLREAGSSALPGGGCLRAVNHLKINEDAIQDTYKLTY